MTLRAALSGMILVSLTGCVASDGFVERAVRQSNAFQNYQSRSSTATFAIIEKSPRFTIVAIGQPPDPRMQRDTTVRVSSGGTVERLYVDIHGGQLWIPDE